MTSTRDQISQFKISHAESISRDIHTSQTPNDFQLNIYEEKKTKFSYNETLMPRMRMCV